MGRRPLASTKPVVENKPAPSFHGGNMPQFGEGVEPSCGRENPFMVMMGSQPKRKYKSSMDNSKVEAKKPKLPLRRSGRVSVVMSSATNKNLAPILEDLTTGNGEDEGVAARPRVEAQPQKVRSSEKDLEEKVISLSEVVEELKMSFEELKSKFEKIEETWSGRAATSDDSLHEECQKKIEALTNENRDLAKKLENAYAMYSKGNCLFGELLEKVKDLMLLFGLKAADTVPSAPDATDSIPGRGLVNAMN